MYLLILISTLALLSDMSNGHIPNELFFLGMMLSQLWAICNHSMIWGLKSLLLSIAVLVILFPLFIIGCLGAGDIKILMIFPGICGFYNTLQIIFIAMLAASVIGVLKLIYYGELRLRLYKGYQFIRTVFTNNKLMVYDRPSTVGDHRLSHNQIHFSLPVFISVAIMAQRISSL